MEENFGIIDVVDEEEEDLVSANIAALQKTKSSKISAHNPENKKIEITGIISWCGKKVIKLIPEESSKNLLMTRKIMMFGGFVIILVNSDYSDYLQKKVKIEVDIIKQKYINSETKKICEDRRLKLIGISMI